MSGVYREIGTKILIEEQYLQSYFIHITLMETEWPEKIRRAIAEGPSC
jgi:hypothetical protein